MKTVADKLLIKPGTAALWVSDREHLGRLGPLRGGGTQPGEAPFTSGK